MGHASSTARFIHLAERRTPFAGPKEYTAQLIGLMSEHWAVHDASILISITGSAQDMSLTTRLEKSFKRGLAQAAQATSAWIVTGGTDSGVMKLVGEGMAEYNALERVQLIGIANWGNIHGREALFDVRDGVIEYAKTKPNDATGANLEPNHTHFLLVDTGLEGGKAWGGEIAFRARLEAEYCRRKRIPRVQVVVQGGPGSLKTVHAAIEDRCPIVVVADSGGVAEILATFVQAYNDPKGKHYGRGVIPEHLAFFENSRPMLEKIAQLDREHRKLHS